MSDNARPLGGRLTGPGGLDVGLSDCPERWDERAGLTDDSITLAWVGPFSGEQAPRRNRALGWHAYFDSVNEPHGGIGGRSIEVVVVDNGDQVDRTVELLSLLLSEDPPFSITTDGTDTTDAGNELLNQQRVPHPLAISIHPAWGDPEGNPWTTGLALSTVTEVNLWGHWIKFNALPFAPARVTLLVVDNETGKQYEDALARYAAHNPDVISELRTFRLRLADRDLEAVVQAMATNETDVDFTAPINSDDPWAAFVNEELGGLR